MPRVLTETALVFTASHLESEDHERLELPRYISHSRGVSILGMVIQKGVVY